MIKVSAILLGAGESKRMGADKLSLPWGKKTVLKQCLDVLLRSNVKEVVLVLSDQTKRMEGQFRVKRVKVIMNPRYREGMSTSIRRGIRATDPGAQGLLIALGDQPLLKTRTIDALIRAFAQSKGSIVLPSYRGRRGHPVLFDRCHERELLSLRGDVGGKSIVERHAGNVLEVPTESAAVLMDIDTWKDYQKGFRMKRIGRAKKGRLNET
jgi:molybdenum cofactor cytidylyltransferase